MLLYLRLLLKVSTSKVHCKLRSINFFDFQLCKGTPLGVLYQSFGFF